MAEGGSEIKEREAIAGERMKASTGEVCEKNGEAFEGRYSRSELEALRYLDVEEQQRRWESIYQGLGVIVARELDQLAVEKHHKQPRKSTDRQQNTGKKKRPAANSGIMPFLHFLFLYTVSNSPLSKV